MSRAWGLSVRVRGSSGGGGRGGGGVVVVGGGGGGGVVVLLFAATAAAARVAAVGLLGVGLGVRGWLPVAVGVAVKVVFVVVAVLRKHTDVQYLGTRMAHVQFGHCGTRCGTRR